MLLAAHSHSLCVPAEFPLTAPRASFPPKSVVIISKFWGFFCQLLQVGGSLGVGGLLSLSVCGEQGHVSVFDWTQCCQSRRRAKWRKTSLTSREKKHFVFLVWKIPLDWRDRLRCCIHHNLFTSHRLQACSHVFFSSCVCFSFEDQHHLHCKYFWGAV